MTTRKTIALTIWTFVGQVMSLLFNVLSRFVIAFLSRSKPLLISWLQSLSAGNVGEWGSISGLGRSPKKGNGYPLQYSYLENSVDRGVW